MAHLRVQILHHGRCFDGAVSAALAIRLVRRLEPAARVIRTRGLAHGTGPPYGPATFDAELNLVVDFRYSSDPRLTWWFDHHGSTFTCAEDQQHYEQDRSGRRFWDPHAPSCASLIRRVISEKLGIDLAALDPQLVAWADRIDTASHEDAASAVKPEAAGDAIPGLLTEPWIAPGLARALDENDQLGRLIRERMRITGVAAVVDLGDLELRSVNKFVPFEAEPRLSYAVMLVRTPDKIKVAVGANPWARPTAPERDLGQLCQRFGGGGHRAVGGISLAPDDLAGAHRVIAEIVKILNSTSPTPGSP
jgi:hypothetical protein